MYLWFLKKSASVLILEQLEKTTTSLLTDSFGRVHDYLRISLTDRCNLRCTYCMPSENMKFALHSTLMTADEIYSIAKIFVNLGVKKIRLTGGEPLVRKDARQIIQSLGELPVELTITTNATKTDSFINDFKNAGIKSVNVSLEAANTALNEVVVTGGGVNPVVPMTEMASSLPDGSASGTAIIASESPSPDLLRAVGTISSVARAACRLASSDSPREVSTGLTVLAIGEV